MAGLLNCLGMAKSGAEVEKGEETLPWPNKYQAKLLGVP